MLGGQPTLHGNVADADEENGGVGSDIETGTGTQLQSYLRFDLGVTREWRTGPGRGRLATFLTVANLFNHTNIAAYLPGATLTAVRPITLAPREVVAGITWHY